MLNPYHSKIDIRNVLALQEFQHQQTLYLAQPIEASAQIDAAVDITSLGHFMLLSWTGAYSTLSDEETDDGVNHLFIQLVDGSNGRELFDDFVAANILLSPGRMQVLAGSGDPSEPLFLEYPFVYTFPLNSRIIVRIRNDIAAAQILKIAFKGIRIFPKSRNEC
jgi:hypothetical protein